MTHPHRTIARDMARCAYAVLFAAAMGATAGDSQAQSSPAVPAATQAPLTPARNAQSRRYEVHQTFDGQAFRKDDSVWVVSPEFAEAFGMPQSYVGPITGAVAAAFRIEEASSQWCGYGGKADNCRRDEQCLLDLYFDESKTPLPWATDLKSQWLPWQSSMKWLRWGERHPAIAGPVPSDVKPNRVADAGIVPFADPATKWQAIFTSNIGHDDTRPEDSVSGHLGIFGYQRQFFESLTMVTLQLGCTPPRRQRLTVRLDARQDIGSPPIVAYYKAVLPAMFTDGVRKALDAMTRRNTEFFRSLFPVPGETDRGSKNSPASK